MSNFHLFPSALAFVVGGGISGREGRPGVQFADAQPYASVLKCFLWGKTRMAPPRALRGPLALAVSAAAAGFAALLGQAVRDRAAVAASPAAREAPAEGRQQH